MEMIQRTAKVRCNLLREKMTFIIDAHQDLAYNSLLLNRDLLLSAMQVRENERRSPIPFYTDTCSVGWPDFQRGQVALIFATLFVPPYKYRGGDWDTLCYQSWEQARTLFSRQCDFYDRLAEEHPDKFTLVVNRKTLKETLKPWRTQPADFPAVTHPTGLILLMEGAEGMESPDELEYYYGRGLRMLAPVWSGARYCGGSYENRPFDREGMELLRAMEELKITLDISHMTAQASLHAMEHFSGAVIASHSNARTVIKGACGERHLTDETFLRLIEHDGMTGINLYNRFLKADVTASDPKTAVSLADVVAHIDHFCQLAGDARHVGIGTDLDGGFGSQKIPAEIDTIADLPLLAQALREKGYNGEDIDGILGENWNRILEKTLPE